MFEAHAYLARGSAADIPLLLTLLDEAGLRTTANPDLYVRTYAALTVDDARRLVERASLRPLGTRRAFVIAATSINAEAQNALLKTLEEPQRDTLFILLHPAPDTLLPTVCSRLQRMTLRGAHVPESPIDPKTFLSAALAKRLDMLKPLFEKEEDAVGARDIAAIFVFLSSLERLLRADKPGSLHALYRARKYCGDRGALLKPLLEQVALLV